MTLVRVIGWGLAGLAALLLAGPRKKRLFVSYHCRKDSAFKRLLQAWSANSAFDLVFEDVSLDASVESGDEDEIRRQIQDRLGSADALLCLVGSQTSRRPWIAFEIDEAKRRGLPIIAVKRHRSFRSPRELLSSGVHWVYGFEFEKIRSAIGKAL